MSKDEFQLLKVVFNLYRGTIDDGTEKYEGIFNDKRIVLTFNPKNTPSKRYNIDVDEI